MHDHYSKAHLCFCTRCGLPVDLDGYAPPDGSVVMHEICSLASHEEAWRMIEVLRSRGPLWLPGPPGLKGERGGAS